MICQPIWRTFTSQWLHKYLFQTNMANEKEQNMMQCSRNDIKVIKNMNWVFSKMKSVFEFNLMNKTKRILFFHRKNWVLMSNYLSEIYGYPQNSRIWTTCPWIIRTQLHNKMSPTYQTNHSFSNLPLPTHPLPFLYPLI